jgi:hypothetical protein
MTRLATLLLVVTAAIALAPGGAPNATAAPSATCAQFASQAAAQHAVDSGRVTIADPDHDGRYCEGNPCPCADPGQPPSTTTTGACTHADRVVVVAISKTRYPAILHHIRVAIRAGWPRVLTIHRAGADRRRDRALAGIPTRPGMDRDEWPMAFARRSWRTHVAYVPSDENRGSGASISLKLRRYCDGTRFRVIGY